MKVQRQEQCNDRHRGRPFVNCPEPCARYAGGRVEPLQPAVAPKEMDHDDQFYRRDGIAVGQRFGRRVFLPGGHDPPGTANPR